MSFKQIDSLIHSVSHGAPINFSEKKMIRDAETSRKPNPSLKISNADAREIAITLVESFPIREKTLAEYKVYIQALARVFQRYTADQGRIVANKIIETKKFLPSIAELIEVCEDMHPPIQSSNPTVVIPILPEFKDSWGSIQTAMKTKMGEAKFVSWIEDLRPLRIEDSSLIVSTHSRFIRDYVITNFRNDIKLLCVKFMGVKDIEIIANDSALYQAHKVH